MSRVKRVPQTTVRVRVDLKTKEHAMECLAGMGLSVSTVMRELIVRIARERRVPFELPDVDSRPLVLQREHGNDDRV